MSDELKRPSESTNQNQISQGEMIELLQNTIGQLEIIVNKLSTESIENLPPRVVVETLTSNTEVLAELFGKPSTETSTKSVQPEDGTTPDILSSENLPQEILFDEQDIDLDEPTEPVRVIPPQGSFNGLQTLCDRGLEKIRSLLPTSLNNKLSDWAIIGTVSVVVIAILLTGVVWVSRPSTEVAQTPIPIPTITPAPSPASEAIEMPEEIEAPGNPEPVEFAPPPEPELTPEQSLIAAIQEQVGDLTRQYPEGLISTIEANFLESRLIVTLGDEWYSLSPSRQNNLANAIFERSRRLDFRKLELIDPEGMMIARSPVVGEEMVILRRIAFNSP